MQDFVRGAIDLDGKLVVVGGAGGGGLGTAITRLVASAGASVLAVDRDQAPLDKHVGPMIDQGLNITPLVANVSTDEGIAAIVEATRTAPGDLYGLVSLIGGVPDRYWGASTRIDRDNWRDMFAYNLDSMFFLTQAIAAELKARKLPGSLVSITSISGLTAAPWQIGYGASKAAIVSVVKTMALELARDGIRVNTVAPGAIRTPTAKVQPEPVRDRWAVPMARQGKAEEIAGAVFFLLSALSGYVTGHCLTVDGGVNLKWTHLDEENVPAYVRTRAFMDEG